MTLRNLIPLLLLPLGIGACSGKNAGIAGKTEYIASLDKLSYPELQQKLKSDIAVIDQLIDSAKGVSLYLNFSISGGPSGSSGVHAADTATPFRLPAAEAVTADFALLKNGVLSEQKFMLPHSGFEFSPNSRLEAIESDDVHYTIDKVFTGGRELPLSQLKLQQIDSLQLQAVYQYPTSFDTLIITKSDKDSVRYSAFSIHIDALKENEATLSLPIAFSNQVIGYQAINNEGVLMNTTGYSSMPVTGVSTEVLDEMHTLRDRLAKAMTAGGKEAALAEVKKIPEHAFVSRDRVQQILEEIEKMAKLENSDMEFRDIVRAVRKFQETYKDILGPREQNLELKFPDKINEIYLFVATGYDSLSQSIIAVNAYDKKVNEVFEDQATGKYGIIDASSNIIIPAKYGRLMKQDESYYVEQVDTNEITYYLDAGKKQLKKISSDKKVVSQLNKELVVFSDKEDYEGVLRNNKEEVVPFRYDDIKLAGNVLVAEGSKRGRSFFEFYTASGKKIDAGTIKKAITTSGNSNIILLAANRKYGVMNGQGEVSIPATYEHIEFISDHKSALLVYAETRPGGNTLFGTISADGKTKSPATFDYIGDLNEGMASFRPANANRDDLKYGFINSQGQVVVPAKFDKAGEYIEGYALVALNNQMCLVDKKGNTMTTFPGLANEAEVSVLGQDAATKGACYEINGKLYTAKGELLKK